MVVEKKHHYIYKIICSVTNKFYVGIHSTNNLEDGYMGSGKKLWRSIKKYGIENHTKEIIEFFPNRDLLINKEKEIVNESLLKDKLCMNIALGGYGGKLLEINGFYGKTHSEDIKLKISNTKKGQGSGEKNSQFGTTWINKDSVNKKIKKTELESYILKGWSKGLYVSKETKEKLSIKAKIDWNKRKMNHSGL